MSNNIKFSATVTPLNRQSEDARTVVGIGNVYINDNIQINGIFLKTGIDEETGELREFVDFPAKLGKDKEWHNVIFPTDKELTAQIKDLLFTELKNSVRNSYASKTPVSENPLPLPIDYSVSGVRVNNSAGKNKDYVDKTTGENKSMNVDGYCQLNINCGNNSKGEKMEIVIKNCSLKTAVNHDKGTQTPFFDLPSRQDKNGNFPNICHVRDKELLSKITFEAFSKLDAAKRTFPIGNTSYSEFFKEGEKPMTRRVSNSEFAEKIKAALDEQGVPYGGNELCSNGGAVVETHFTVKAEDFGKYEAIVNSIQQSAKSQKVTLNA